jgi:MOSC domain-containing protein YiiM
MPAEVIAVARSVGHHFSKLLVPEIEIVAGHGVAGDAHGGPTVRHRSRVKVDPSQPNLRQVHLIHCELFEDVGARGFAVGPADLGENITTRGIDLLGLPRGAVLAIGATVRLEVTGLRNPCAQIEAFAHGLLAAVLEKRDNGTLVRKAGIMTVARVGGWVRPGDAITVEWPAPPYIPLERV